MVNRTPEHYVHADGMVVIMPARVAAVLNRHAKLDEFRLAHRGFDPEVDAVLLAMRRADLQWRVSVTGTSEAAKPELDPQLNWLSTTQVAAITGITDRGVRAAIGRGDLVAECPDGRYRISREELAHWRSRRQ
ncbi:helix-turn-helix domain-containing protein [Microcella alkalica]|uniref:Helix-turn-helix domain-containing protein n=1 Tax=Microcella alkalica TaxID=355930 RepID=A0A839EDJ8_9MICO|nr:helix-turn-helix domain-containing protein [Microcella alkalica]MBA8847405.1 hypothetical protein [Microcella alkalica]